MEKWKPIADYEELYEVSDCGQVRSLRNDCLLKQCVGSKGYLLVTLCKSGTQKTANVHRLVAEAFLENPNSYPCVNHIDENKRNNDVSNLEWCSYYHNNVYGQRLTKSALKRGKPVLCVETNTIYPSTQAAYRETNIQQSGISQCCNGKRKSAGGFTWRFV